VHFRSDDPGDIPPRDVGGVWRWVLLGGAAVAAAASLQPWTRVRFGRVFGEVLGPPGWESSAGFTCLCTSALLAVITLSETPSLESRAAVRPASLLLAAGMTAAQAAALVAGPGTLRGVTAAFTSSFYVGCAAAAAVFTASLVRARGRARRRPSAAAAASD
jgi:hypothetical protein